MGIGEFNSNDHYICGQEFLRRNGVDTTSMKVFLTCGEH